MNTKAVRTFFLAALVTITAVLAADLAFAGKGPASSRCKSDRNCGSGVCVRATPSAKFGTCCQPASCESRHAQCGALDDGCGAELDCGPCDGDCLDNQCFPTTTTTSTTTTSTTSTTTTSTTSTTSTTLPPTTTTTLDEPHQCTDDIQCESGCCDFRDPDVWQCGTGCCLGCWHMCFNACGCLQFPSTCTTCMNGCVPANCGCPNY